jgi:uncharacterized protein
MMLTPFDVGWTVWAVFLVAGAAKGLVGLGLPTVAMGLLALLMAPPEAAAMVLIPSLATNVWQMLAGGHLWPLVRRFWPMLAAASLATVLGVGLMSRLDSAHVTLALGAVLVVYGALGLGSIELKVSPNQEPWLSPAVGLGTGLVTGATGIFVLPAVPYLQATGLARDALVQAMGLSFTVSTVALGIGLAGDGHLSVASVQQSMAALVPAAIGMMAGQRLRHWLEAKPFRRLFYIAVTLLGGQLVVRALF